MTIYRLNQVPFAASQKAETILSDPIFVARPYLPPIDEFLPLLKQIWGSGVLTNNGPFHQRFEAALSHLFGAGHVSLIANGMLALSTAIEAAGIEGEVITTPYSFVATTHAVKMGKLTPVFADIRASDLNIDPARVEAAITPRTSAIVAVHCYGNPCDVDALQAIADRHGLALIYDAAHAFGVVHKGRALVTHGDFATLSFHATKAFNTFEGGAVIAHAAAGKSTVDNLRNFGIASETSIPAVGGNAKMSEFNAALGLVQLNHFEHVRAARQAVDGRYRAMLADVAGIELLALPADTNPNYSYFPILVGDNFGLSRDALYEALKRDEIYSRRYFYPLLSSLPMYRDLPSAAPGNLPVAARAAEQILCLPIYPDLSEAEQARVVAVIRGQVR